jgi:hypothetical protein
MRLPRGPPGPPPLPPIPIRGLCLGCLVGGGLRIASSSSSFIGMVETALPRRRLLVCCIFDGAELGAWRFDNRGVVLATDAPVCDV